MQTTQQVVRVADLYQGRFVQAPGERAVDFEDRLLALEAAQDGTDGEYSKVLSYVDAIERGAALPPVFVVEVEGEMHVVDGFHRCAAAAVRGRAAVRAVVFQAVSYEACDALSELFFNYEDTGTPWQLRAQAGAALLAA